MYLSFRPALCKAKTTLCMCNWIPELYAQSFWDHLNSHCSPWLAQAINEYRSEVGHPLCDESYFGNFSIGNIYDFEKTSEKSGIPRIPPQVKADNNMISCRCDAYFETNSSDSSSIVSIENKSFCWNKEHIMRITKDNNNLFQLGALPVIWLPIIYYSSNQFMYRYLSLCQDTKYAVTAVHTPQEKTLFISMLEDGDDNYPS